MAPQAIDLLSFNRHRFKFWDQRSLEPWTFCFEKQCLNQLGDHRTANADLYFLKQITTPAKTNIKVYFVITNA